MAEPSRAAFSAGVFVAALEPPTYQGVGGDVHVGVFVSADEYWRLQAKLARVLAPGASYDAQAALLREMTDLSFPKPWWAFWRRSVWQELSRLPFNAQLEAVNSFMKAQALANDPDAWAKAKRGATNGTDSPR